MVYTYVVEQIINCPEEPESTEIRYTLNSIVNPHFVSKSRTRKFQVKSYQFFID